MSAWIVDKEHIDMMVTAIIRSEIVQVSAEPDEIGRQLWAENVKSIHARYPDTAENDCDYPGPCDFTSLDVDLYHYEPTPLLDVTGLANAFRCYDYQTCEHDDYRTGAIAPLVVQMAEALEAHPDYDEHRTSRDVPWALSGWGVTADTLAALS